MNEASTLTPAQRNAMAHVAARTDGGPIDRSLRVTLNFHPDRVTAPRDPGAVRLPILDAMAHDGIYRSQFETRTSNGGLTAHPGGDRWGWESRIFGAAYDAEPPSGRPKYGSLNFRRSPGGGAPRFGSAYLRLSEATLDRTTFCYPDSVFEPVHFGVAAHMALVCVAEADDKDALDDYIEAQVHGTLDLADDVEALVLDPCFQDTAVEAAAEGLPCPLEWHSGWRLSVDELRRHPNYRGPQFVELGCSLAREGHLDARVIGEAARSGCYEEQDLKRVWHYVARFGVHRQER